MKIREAISIVAIFLFIISCTPVRQSYTHPEGPRYMGQFAEVTPEIVKSGHQLPKSQIYLLTFANSAVTISRNSNINIHFESLNLKEVIMKKVIIVGQAPKGT